MIRRKGEVELQQFTGCHDGTGTLDCMAMLHGGDSELGFSLFHHDIIPPDVSIGEHLHTDTEEIYYLLSGDCVLTYDGAETGMKPGDFSVVKRGHSHGIANVGETAAELIVVEIR